MTNTRWRILIGAINAGAAFLLVQPLVQQYPIVLLVLGTVVAVLGFIQAPQDDVGA